MDQFLAELYGTNEPGADDFEKVAHLDFLEKVAEEEGIDLDELDDEDLEELAEIAAEALEEEEGYEEEGEDDGEYEEEYEDDDLEKEAEAKVEEADFLGRVMAHSFNQEMDNIDKEAGARTEALKRGLARGGAAAEAGIREGVGRGRRAARQLGKAVGKSPLGRLGESSSLKGRMKARASGAARAAGGKADRLARRLGRRLGAPDVGEAGARGASAAWKAGKGGPRKGSTRLRRMGDRLTMGKTRRRAAAAMAGRKSGRAAAMKSQRLRGYGAIGAGAAGLGAAGAGAAYAGREKKSADEQWDEAVQARAWEHLMASGLADEQGNFIPAEELDLGKTASDDEIEYELDANALELLEAEGYPVEWY